MREAEGSRIVVYAALAGNVAVAATKLFAAAFTGSAAMFSEAVHSVIDTSNEALLLHGYRQSERRPNALHPLGYGRELYFWCFIVALLLFGLGAGVSLYQGIRHVLDPQPVEHAVVNYVVLALSFGFESASWLVAWRRFSQLRGDDGVWRTIRQSKDPPSFLVLFEDSAALIGIVLAALGIFLADWFDMPVFDGIASILIGLVLAVVATWIAIESKSLLIGEAASPQLVEAICNIARQQRDVAQAHSAITVQLAPDQAVVALSIEFSPTLTAPEVEACVARIDTEIRSAHPNVVALFVKPQTVAEFRRVMAARFGYDPLATTDAPATDPVGRSR